MTLSEKLNAWNKTKPVGQSIADVVEAYQALKEAYEYIRDSLIFDNSSDALKWLQKWGFKK